MNRKLPTPRDYIIGTALLLMLGIPLLIAIVAIGVVYWTCRGIRVFAEPIGTEQQT